MMSTPTFTRMLASTAWGILEAKLPAPRTMVSKITACRAPDMGVCPPALMLTTVRMVAPALGKPPNKPAIVLPIPWPISSRSGLWMGTGKIFRHQGSKERINGTQCHEH